MYRTNSSVLTTTALLGALALSASAQTITVNTTQDVVDFTGAQQVSDLPGPDGAVSFREACIAANKTAGPQTIAFAIPQTPPNEWSSGIAMLFMDFDIFSLTDNGTTVDFTTQTAFTGDTNPLGNEVGIRTAPITNAPAIYVSGDQCTIKGLDRVLYCGYAIELAGNHNRVIGCTISGPLHAAVYITGGFGGPTATGNVVGGVLPGEGNVLSSGNDGVRIDAPADDNVVVGNVLKGSFNGAAVRGSIYTTTANNNRIGGPTAAERNIIAGSGKHGEEGFPVGAQVSLELANGTLIEGNYIGTNPAAAAAQPQIGPTGVSLRDSAGTVIRNNVISGIIGPGAAPHYAGKFFGMAVLVQGKSSGTVLWGNRIGTNAAGDAPIPNYRGLAFAHWPGSGSPTDCQIGGLAPGQGNIIAYSTLLGVRVDSAATGIRISGNSIFDNGELGIDLLSASGAAGVSPNDPGDGDTGGNGLQNYPEFTLAHSNGSTLTHVEGTLPSKPNQSYTLEFFASDACDPSGFGEGAEFLGAIVVTTNASGLASFAAELPAGSPIGGALTATATDTAGNTSEFSACLTIAPGASVVGDINGDGDVDQSDLGILLADYGCTSPPAETCAGDLDGDGDTDQSDLGVLLASYGS
jgi:hypothetical protein